MIRGTCLVVVGTIAVLAVPLFLFVGLTATWIAGIAAVVIWLAGIAILRVGVKRLEAARPMPAELSPDIRPA